MKYFIALILFLALQPVLNSSCKKQGPSVTPEIKVNSASAQIAEDVPNGTSDVAISLSEVTDKTVSIDYVSADSTAVAGKDYVTLTSGTITFQPGEKMKKIRVIILADYDKKEDTYFKIVLSNPVNSLLPEKNIIVKIVNVDYAKLVWSDEFTGSSLNTEVWNYELGGGGWGNNELETYTNSINNVHSDTGYLHITALNPSPNSYTSGRLTTKGKKEFTYFRVDIRAKMPEGKGLWPALWALGANISTVSWPKCGEIDIMEYLGHTPSIVYGTLHWDASGHQQNGSNYNMSTGKFSTGFHVFSLIWTPSQFKWLVDDHIYYTLSKGSASAFPFDLPQFFIFNVAVGGNWPGSPDANTVFPQSMIVDYIRVYQ
jgi:hypothetical protein